MKLKRLLGAMTVVVEKMSVQLELLVMAIKSMLVVDHGLKTGISLMQNLNSRMLMYFHLKPVILFVPLLVSLPEQVQSLALA